MGWGTSFHFNLRLLLLVWSLLFSACSLDNAILGAFGTSSGPDITIDDVSVVEGDTLAFTISLSDFSDKDVNVNWRTLPGTATVTDSDYTSVALTTVTIPAGSLTLQVNVVSTADAKFEADEIFTITLTNPVNGELADKFGVGTITNDDTEPDIFVSDASVLEGETAQVVVSLSEISGMPTVFVYRTFDDVAVQPSDYVQVSASTRTIPAGSLSLLIPVVSVEDLNDEVDETVLVSLTSVTNANVGVAGDDDLGELTITDDDAAPQIFIVDATVTEGSTFQFLVSLVGTASVDVTFDFDSFDDTATIGDGDYTGASASGTILAGSLTTTISLVTTADTKYEANETLLVSLSSLVNATTGDLLATGTITNDDTPPGLVVFDGVNDEGDALLFPVSLSEVSSVNVVFNWVTLNGTATTGDTDYTQVTTTAFTIPAGSLTGTLSVTTIEDTKLESNETLSVSLSGVTGASVTDDVGLGTITNDDAAPTLKIYNLSLSEGHTANFTVSLSALSGIDVVFAIQTFDLTATAGQDYTQLALTTLTIPASQTSLTQSVLTIDDIDTESSETFIASLSSITGATLAVATDDLGTATILSNDSNVSIFVSDASAVTEGGTSTFIISLSAAHTSDVTFNFQTFNDTATSGQDYTAVSSTAATILAGNISLLVSVVTTDDSIDEVAEFFSLSLSGIVDANVGVVEGQGEITDDDNAPAIFISDASVAEGGTLVFAVSIAALSSLNATFDFSTFDDTATTANSDYTSTTAVGTIAAGALTTWVAVVTTADTTYENNETLIVSLSNLNNATVGVAGTDDTATGTITNNDSAPAIYIVDAVAVEGSSLNFVISLAAVSPAEATFVYESYDGAATLSGGAQATTADSDYVAISGAGTIPAGALAITISMSTNVDATYEGMENLIVSLSSLVGATSGDVLGLGLIHNDDCPATGWCQQSYLKAPYPDSDRFGTSLAISADTIVVGANYESSNQSGVTNGTGASSNNSTSSGAAYVFKRSGNTWVQQAYLKAPYPDIGDNFGVSAAISGDTIVIGADGERSNQRTVTNGTGASTNNSNNFAGAAYVFKRTGNTWVQEAYIKAPNSESLDSFGTSLGISNDTIVVGAWGERSNQSTITNGTGASGNNSNGSAGAAYVFKRTGNTWIQQAYLKSPFPDPNDNYGISTSISDDTIVVGARGESSNQSTITNGTGASNNNSVMSAGAAYVYKRTGSTWVQEAFLKAPYQDTYDSYGVTTALSSNTIVVGTNAEASNQSWITNGTGASSDNSTTGAGAAYVYKRTGNTWVQEAYLKASNPDNGDNFSKSLSVFGDTIVVGAYGERSNQSWITNGTIASSDNTFSYSGAAYVFKRAANTWVQQAYLKSPNSDSGDQFGISASVSGDTIVVGALYEASNYSGVLNAPYGSSDNSSSYAGAAYVFYYKGEAQVLLQQSATQADPASALPVSFAVDFGKVIDPLTFTDADITQNGTATGVTWVITNSGDDRRFTLQATAGSAGTYIPSIAAGLVTDLDGNTNLASSANIDNSVTLYITPDLTVSDASVTEGSSLVFTASLSATNISDAVFTWQTFDQTALLGDSDYTQVTTRTATIPAGQLTLALIVATTADVVDESDETLLVSLTAVSSVNITDDLGAGTIQDNDGPAANLFIINASVNEGGTLAFAVSISATQASDVTFDFTTYDGTATSADSDYTSVTASGTVPNGALTTTVFVATTHDTKTEANQTLTVSLSNSVNATVAVPGSNDIATGTITNDDANVTLVTSTLANGTYTIGQIVPIYVVYDQVMTVTGTPQLVIEAGIFDEYADYVSGSGTSTLVFNYLVAFGNETPDLNYVDLNSLILNGGTIDFGSFAANLVLPSELLPQSLSGHKDIVIDALGPMKPTGFDDGSLEYDVTKTPIFRWNVGPAYLSVTTDFEVAIGSQPGGYDVMNWISVGNVTMTSFTGMSLTSAQTYYASLRAKDTQGNYSLVVQGDGWRAGCDIEGFCPSAYFVSPNVVSNSFAIQLAVSGDTLAVASPNDEISQTGIINGTGAGAPPLDAFDRTGSVYVYRRVGATWYQEAILRSSYYADYSDFGAGVAIDGDTIAVGASAERNNSTIISHGTNINFVGSVNSEGAVFVFKRTGATWSQEAYLKAPNSYGNQYFGSELDLNGNTIVVGTSNETSNQNYITNGTSASTNRTLNYAGAAYVFKRNGSTWYSEAYIKPANMDQYDEFGTSVAIDVDTIAVTSRYEASNLTTVTNGTGASSNNSFSSCGAAYVYKRNANTWYQEAYIKASNSYASLGYGNSLDIDGDTLVVGASQENSPSNVIVNGTGSSIDQSDGGNGAVYVYKRTGSTWVQQAYIKASNSDGGDDFGASISIESDTLAVGAPREDSNLRSVVNLGSGSQDNSYSESGAVYVYKRSGNTWYEYSYIKPANALADYLFGYSVFLRGSNLFVGAPNASSLTNEIINGPALDLDNYQSAYMGPYGGMAYVFNNNASAPNIFVGDAAAVTEGGTLLFTVSIVATSGSDVVFNYTTADYSATSGSDYVAKSGVGTIPTGSLTLLLPVDTLNNADLESAEQLVIRASSPINGVLVDNVGLATIRDNDADPGVILVTSTLANGSYRAGQVIPISIVFDQEVTVTGTPRLTLETGATDAVVDYSSGSGSITLIFDYTVASGEVSDDLNYLGINSLQLNGGTIVANGNNANLTLPAMLSEGSLRLQKDIKILLSGPMAPLAFDDGSVSYSTTTSPTFTWTASVPDGSAIAAYEIAIGLSGVNDIRDWTDVSNVTSTSIGSLTLALGSTYFASIRARDGLGNYSPVATGDGFIVGCDINGFCPQAFIKAANVGSNDEFGAALALSGNTAVVGARSEDSNQTSITNGTSATTNNSRTGSGAVYVYGRVGSTWFQQAYIKAVNADSSDEFGTAVDISGDSIIVGAPLEASNLTTVTNGTTASSDNSITGAGAAYIYKRTGGTWYQEAFVKVANIDVLNSEWPQSAKRVKIRGDTALVSYEYEQSSGTSIINGTGANTDINLWGSGAVFVYQRTGNTWVQQAYLKPSRAKFWGYFGRALAIDSDTIAVGADDDSDFTTVLNGTGATTAGQNTYSGAVYVYKRTGNTWAQQAILKASNARADQGFGEAVALDTDTIVVGAVGESSLETSVLNGTLASSDNSGLSSGAAYVFNRTGDTWVQGAYLKASNADSSDLFGKSVAISGSRIVIGAPEEDANQAIVTNGASASSNNSSSKAGAAYVFKKTAGSWAQVAYLKAPNAGANDLFGTAVAIDGDTVIVGAHKEDSNQATITNGLTASTNNSSSSSGAAYVFTDLSAAVVPYVLIFDAAPVTEGGTAHFVVSLTATSVSDVVFNYTTVNGTATSAQDYTTTSGSGTILAGSLTLLIAVPTTDDGADEAGIEAFKIFLSSLSNANFADTYGVGQIRDNDTKAVVVQVTSPVADGYYGKGKNIPVEVVFDRPVTVTGSPLLQLETGSVDRLATYASGSGSLTLTFNYAVDEGDSSTDLNYLATDALKLNGGTIVEFGTASAANIVLPDVGTSLSLGGSKNISLDTQAPTFNSAISAEKYTNDLVNSPLIAWGAATDTGGSGIKNYLIAIGTSAGGTQTLNWTNIGNVTYYQLTGATLSHGTTYYVSIVAVDNAGNISGTWYWGNWLVDTVPLAVTNVDDGAANYFSDWTPWLSWSHVSAGAPLDHYEVAIGTSAGDDDIYPWTTVNSDVLKRIDLSSGTLVDGNNYYLSVKSVDKAGNTSAAVNGDGWYQGCDAVGYCPEAYIHPINGDNSDEFGTSTGLDGDTLVVGAPKEESGQNTITNGTTASSDNSVFYSGAAYVYRRLGSTWYQEAYLKASNVSYSEYGRSVAIDGDTIIVGAPAEGTSQSTITNGTTASTSFVGTAFGAAFVYQRTANTWVQQAYLKPPNPDEWDYFGYQVDIDGDTAVVGAFSENSNQITITNGATASSNDTLEGAGAAYVFKRTGSTWAPEAYLKPPNIDTNDNFGAEVSISGDTIIVGAYNESSSQTYITNGTLASADNSITNSGAVYVFKRTGNTWAQEAYIKPHNAQSDSGFGYRAAIDGDTIIVGSMYERSSQTFISNGTSGPYDQDKPHSGAAYVYKRVGNTWYQEAYLKASNNRASLYFGHDVAIDGSTVVVSSFLEGSKQTWITNGTAASSDTSFTYGTGAAYVFKRQGSTWEQTAYLKPANVGSAGYFGYDAALSISNDTIAVGAQGAVGGKSEIINGPVTPKTGVSSSGATYIYTFHP